MKKIVSLITIAIVAVVLVCCSQSSAAKKVAISFLQAYYVDKDFDKAKEYSTEASHSSIEYKEMMLMMSPVSESSQIKFFEYQSIEVDKNRATCRYMVLGEIRVLYLSKINRKWLVDMPESTIIEPTASLSLTSGQGGFASAQSEPIRLSDIPTVEETK
ncbi:hypothetical protein FACS1894153_3490 [Bacteroidia bacterium]|nr:hypothetical protein FACS1894153_3490 [Bacteroidia bacterium]